MDQFQHAGPYKHSRDELAHRDTGACFAWKDAVGYGRIILFLLTMTDRDH